MVTYGLFLISAAWLLQFLFISQKNHKINPLFPAVYAGGVILLVLDGFTKGITMPVILNLTSLLASFAVLVKIYKK